MEMIEDRAIEAVSCAGSAVGTGLKEVTICPAGEVKSLNGTFHLDDQAALTIIKAFEDHGRTPVVVDYQHETIQPGARAPAAGWIRSLYFCRTRGLRGMIEWTDKARAAIRAREFKFLSPVLLINKSDRRAVKLGSVGLVNQPAIPSMQELTLSARDARKESMKMTDENKDLKTTKEEAEKREQLSDQAMIKHLDRIRQLLDMTTDQTFEEVLEAAADRMEAWLGEDEDGDMVSGNAAIVASVRETLGLQPDAGKDEIVLAMSVGDTGSAAELVRMREVEVERIAHERVDKYCEMNVINPNNKEQMNAAMSLAREDPARFEALMSRTPPYVPPGRITPPSDRSMILINAAREYKRDEHIQKSCSPEAWLNDKLREAGMNTMSDDETREFVRV